MCLVNFSKFTFIIKVFQHSNIIEHQIFINFLRNMKYLIVLITSVLKAFQTSSTSDKVKQRILGVDVIT